MFSTILQAGYPFGVAICEVSYTWRDLPDDVKSGERDHVEYAEACLGEQLGRGEWICPPILHDSVWRGLYLVYRSNTRDT